MIYYPSILPLPTIKGYAETYAMQVIDSEMEDGHRRLRKAYENKPHIVNCEFVFTENQKNVFDYFYYNETQSGAKSFFINIKSADNDVNEVRIISNVRSRLLASNVYALQVTMEVLNRQLISADNYLANVHIDDITQARDNLRQAINGW